MNPRLCTRETEAADQSTASTRSGRLGTAAADSDARVGDDNDCQRKICRGISSLLKTAVLPSLLRDFGAGNVFAWQAASTSVIVNAPLPYKSTNCRGDVRGCLPKLACLSNLARDLCASGHMKN